MEEEFWTPRIDRPHDLVRPSRIDPTGRTGPTRHQARRGRWRTSSPGWHVPSSVDATRVEQRILEQAMRARRDGAVTAWASLRWQGAAYFEGSAGRTEPLLPVPLLRSSGARQLDDGLAVISRAQLAQHERVCVSGVWCTTVPRATFDEVLRLRSLRPGVAAICMTLAAGLGSLDELSAYAASRPAWEGIPLYRSAVALSNECFRSGPEVYLHLRWRLDAGFPEPLVNPPVFDLSGRLLGYPDLLDVGAGVVGEYNGSAHRGRERHRRDVAREERFRGCGLEYFTVVAGDLADERLVVDRMTATRRRARFARASERLWTLTPPPWWRPPPWLPARYSAARCANPGCVKWRFRRRTIDVRDQRMAPGEYAAASG
ncbi:MAG: hypothetical protein ACRDO4_13975 [Nocardioides sp.]